MLTCSPNQTKSMHGNLIAKAQVRPSIHSGRDRAFKVNRGRLYGLESISLLFSKGATFKGKN